MGQEGLEKIGFIKLHRRLLDNPISKRPNYAWLFVVLLLKANHRPNKIMWNKEIIVIQEGQLITGRKQLSIETGIPETTIEDILNFLEKQHQIRQQKTTKFRLITIINWKQYQTSDSVSDNKPTTDRQQADTNKNDKNVKNEKEELANASLPLEDLKANTGKKPKSFKEFRDARREESGRPPMTPRKPTEKQQAVTDAFKDIEYFKQKGYADHGMMFMEVKNEKRNMVVRKLVIKAHEILGDLKPLIDWWFSGEGEWAQYEPEQCFSSKAVERFKNKGKGVKTKKEWWQ